LVARIGWFEVRLWLIDTRLAERSPLVSCQEPPHKNAGWQSALLRPATLLMPLWLMAMFVDSFAVTVHFFVAVI
jgi:hypothetical protein